MIANAWIERLCAFATLRLVGAQDAAKPQAPRTEELLRALAELDCQVDAHEGELQKGAETIRSCYMELRGTPKHQLWTEFAEIDRVAFDAASFELIETPVLGRFSGKIAIARAGKLMDPNEGKAPSPPSH